MRKMCQHRVDDIVDRIHELCAQGREQDASALYEEIQDWVLKDDIEVLSLDYINGQFNNC
jgi:hypothetical protein